jgi:hypothetical protein
MREVSRMKSKIRVKLGMLPWQEFKQEEEIEVAEE